MHNRVKPTDEDLLFSVIVPVYNTEAYLKRCLDSISCQTERCFECILIDDGSTDNSGIICDQFALDDNRFIVMHSPNQGVSAARNLGLECARGKYIVFIDSDDWVGENYLLDLLYSDADYLCQQFVKCSEDGREDRVFDLKEEELGKVTQSAICRLLQSGGVRYPFAKRFKREMILQNHIRFDESIDNSEDTLFIVDYLHFCKNAVFQKKANYYYVRYVTRNTLSNSISLERFTEVCRAKGLISARLYKKGSDEYQHLYYNQIGYTYMCYQWSVYFLEKRGFLENYYFGLSFMHNKDVRRVIECSPDAIWALPVSQRMMQAFEKNDRFLLFRACFREVFCKRTL